MRSPLPSLVLAAAAAASLVSAAGSHGGAHHGAAGSVHHAVRDAVARQGPSVLLERAAELEADSEECDDEEAAQAAGNYTDEGDDAAEWFAGNDYDAVRRMQERAVKEGLAAHLLDKRVAKNPKFIPNPKFTASLIASSGGGSSSASKTTTKRELAASTAIVVGTPTAGLSIGISVGVGISASPTASSSASKTTAKASSTSYSLPSASSDCYQMYTKLTGGAIYGPQAGTGAAAAAFLPKPSTFVTRTKNKLYLDGEEFRITGPNIYWLGLDENVNWAVSYPGHSRIREAMAMTVAMGGNTIRAHTLGVSKTLWPTAYNTNEDAWDTIDYSIYAAREYGLRLIIPLTDNYAYYHGGKYDFIGWGGADTDDGTQFYSNSKVIKIFKDYISVLLNHVNTYTGVALKDDPTILAWETGNELGGYMLGGGAPPASWTKAIAKYIKALAPNHLVADGTDGLTDYGGSLANTGVTVDEVDLVTDHFYPALQWLLEKDIAWMKSYTSKVFYVGENDWTGQKGGSDLDTFYSTIKSASGTGSMMWSMFGRDDQCCDWIKHNDGYSLYYPNGMTSTVESYAGKLMKHWYSMRGLTAPSVLPAIACPQLELS
ncbi:hypothetical protein JCM10207_006101 [Rhodosporidiobolus poonsookiae]